MSAWPDWGVVRKIPIEQLVPGMYVVDVHRSWFAHRLWRRRFLVGDAAAVSRLYEDGIREVSIDTVRGLDVPPLPGLPPVPLVYVGPRWKTRSRPQPEKPPAPPVSLDEERRRAGLLLREAVAAVQGLINTARAGQVADTACLEPLVRKMVASVLRNPDALIPLARLKSGNAYPAEHAVASAALIVALARHEKMGEGEIAKLALGSLVKDIGLASLENRVIAKRGELSRYERALVESHVEESLAALGAPSRLPESTVAVVLEHHERYDGFGYPCRVAGEAISSAGRMAAIVDTYDALTAERPYRRALSPSQALRQVYERGGSQFDPSLVASFVHTVGVFPVGSLVRLESGHLAVVVELHHDDLMRPIVRVIYHAGQRRYVTPVKVDLSRRHGNHYGRIVGAEEFERWGLNSLSWQPV